MNFELTEEQKIFIESFKKFAEKEILPLSKKAEEKGETPTEIFRKAGSLGYLCIGFPQQYGGCGMDLVTECIQAEILGQYGGLGVSSSLMVQSGIGTRLILNFGNEDQKKKYLIPAAKGEKISAFALTEPDAGSDVSAIKTKAVKEGDYYVLNGNKIFITNGNIADFFCVAAYTDKEKGHKEGMSIFIVERGLDGITTKKIEKYVAHSADTAEIFFTDLRIPSENLIGEDGKGYKYLMEVLYEGRITHAGRSVGLAQACFDLAKDYAEKRVQFGRPVSKFQVTKFKFAEMATEIECARRFNYFCAWGVEKKVAGYRKYASMAKLYASEVAQRVSSQAMQIYGGYGITKEYPIFPIFAGLRLATITEGTSEIQKLIIASELEI